MEDVLIKKWEGIAARYQELTNQLMDPVVAQSAWHDSQAEQGAD